MNTVFSKNKIGKVNNINNGHIYYSLLYFKWIKRIRSIGKKELSFNMNISLLNIKYTNYILILKKLDNDRNINLNLLDINKTDKYLGIADKNDINKLFDYYFNNNVIKYQHVKSINKNIIDEYYSNIKLRKVENKIMIPHYFFTPRYVEKSKISQVKHWTSSIYSFNKSNKVKTHYLDYYTEKLINSFFNISFVKIKNIWDEKFLLDGYKILPNSNIIRDMNILIKYTSGRTSKSIKNTVNLSKIIFNYPWLKEKINFSVYVKDIIKERKTFKFGGFFSKKKIELDNINRILLSKPLFKHTSYNLIIDLFLFNNKKYILNKFDHIIWRRTLYKYIYSMYYNCKEKINDTISRPRFFYINILEPRIYNLYKKVVKSYENILILNNKLIFVYFCISILISINKNINTFKKKDFFLKSNYKISNKMKYKKEDDKYFTLSKIKSDKNKLEEGHGNISTISSWLEKYDVQFYLFNYRNETYMIENRCIKDFLISYDIKKSLRYSNVPLNDNLYVPDKNKGIQNEYNINKISRNIRNIDIWKKGSHNTVINNNNYKYKLNNIKILWNDLNYSLISILYNMLNIKGDKLMFGKREIYKLLRFINININSSNLFYYINKLALIENEFYSVNRDILKTNRFNEIPTFYKSNLGYYSSLINNLKDKITLKENKEKKLINLHVWRSYFNIKGDYYNYFLKNYNNNIFKPYYRYMIPLFILKSYKSMLSYIGYKNTIHFFNNSVIKSSYLKWFNMNHNILYNYIIVKVLLDLFKYNYRSLIKVKSKYFFINKLRYFESKIRRLKFNSWISTIKYMKKLRNTPRNFWKRYHKLAGFYYARIIQNAELDTERKIFVPFLIYFEDILFTIYNKPVILRLWPLKRYFLSSIILAKRIMATILMRQHKVSLGGYRKVVRKLMSTFKALEIKKAYDFYISNNSRWPINLINVMNSGQYKRTLKYSNLEYYSKKNDRYDFLNTYFLRHYNLSNNISIVKNNYLQEFLSNIFNLKTGVKKNLIRSFKRSELIRSNYIYYWIRPLKNYIMQLRRSIDISGVKFKLSGRSGIRRNNMRKFKKTKYFGNLIGPIHSSMRVKRNISLYNPQLIGHIKSNIDYSYSWGITRNGCLSLKIWISSLFSVDLRELLLHLMKIKNLYYYIINRYYVVENKFISDEISVNYTRKRVIRNNYKKHWSQKWSVLLLKKNNNKTN
jgi:hypothetical protein